MVKFFPYRNQWYFIRLVLRGWRRQHCPKSRVRLRGSRDIHACTFVVNNSVTNIMASLITITNTTSGTVSGSIINATNYGAVGDAVQFNVNTVSNSVLVTTTNVLPLTSIGDAIEIFNAGTQTYGVNSYGTNAYGNQDLVGTIVNLVNGTNIYISLPAQQSLVNAFATYGYNNQDRLQNAINATVTNDTLYIPAGTYLVLPATNASVYGYIGLTLSHGGITISGAGPGNTRLLSQGAWQMESMFGTYGPWRGMLFQENAPIVNNSPIVPGKLDALDGGVQQGEYCHPCGIVANTVDGLGWDTTHDAFVVWSLNSFPGH